MNRVSFGEGACERTRKYLDSYISNELLVETTHEVLRHLESCAACAADADSRARLRTRLRSAVRSEAVPPELQVHIRQSLRERESRRAFGIGWNRWFAMAAASVVLCAGVWLNYSRERMPDVADRPAQNVYIRNVSSAVAAVLRVGLGDHLHCAIFRKGPKTVVPVAQMETDLGPSFRGLLGVVNASVPAGYHIVMGHECSYLGRKYIHLTLEKDGSILSLVIARKQDSESLAGLSPAAQPAAVPIYQSAAGRSQIAAFDAGRFLAYVVSDLKGRSNLQVASALAPGVHEFLVKTPA
jgi:hypothetical protein